jgi:hypothetical protein
MYIESLSKREFEMWMGRITERLDALEEKMTRKKERPTLDGEQILDNQDVCMMLNISKRTLQRYRSLGWLPYRQIDQKVYYTKSDIEELMGGRLQKKRVG